MHVLNTIWFNEIGVCVFWNAISHLNKIVQRKKVCNQGCDKRKITFRDLSKLYKYWTSRTIIKRENEKVCDKRKK